MKKERKIFVEVPTKQGNKQFEIVIEKRITELQKYNLIQSLKNSAYWIANYDFKLLYESDFIVNELMFFFDKVGRGGSHIWFSNLKNERLGYIKL